MTLSITNLLSLLDTPDDDRWFDNTSLLARREIDTAPTKVVSTLLELWNNLTTNQQEHLAYILSSGNSPLEDSLITQMCLSENKGVAYRAWVASLSPQSSA